MADFKQGTALLLEKLTCSEDVKYQCELLLQLKQKINSTSLGNDDDILERISLPLASEPITEQKIQSNLSDKKIFSHQDEVNTFVSFLFDVHFGWSEVSQNTGMNSTGKRDEQMKSRSIINELFTEFIKW